MKLVIARHAQSYLNVIKVLNSHPSDEDQLSERGIEEAEDLGRHLEKKQFDIIITSELNRAIQTAKKMGEKKITVRSDSELLVKQLNGEYKVKKPHLKKLNSELVSLIKDMEVKFEHIPRERNKRADALSKKAAENED